MTNDRLNPQITVLMSWLDSENEVKTDLAYTRPDIWPEFAKMSLAARVAFINELHQRGRVHLPTVLGVSRTVVLTSSLENA